MTDLAGIGDVLGKRLAGKGFDRVRTVNINYSGHADGSMELFLSYKLPFSINYKILHIFQSSYCQPMAKTLVAFDAFYS